MLLNEMTDHDLMLFMAYIIHEFNSFKNKCYEHDVDWAIKEAPMNINANGILIEILNRTDRLEKNISINDHIDLIKKHLFDENEEEK